VVSCKSLTCLPSGRLQAFKNTKQKQKPFEQPTQNAFLRQNTEGYTNQKIKPMLIQKYNPNWIKDFNDIKKVITEALINLHVPIEHVGSTSIPNLAGKAIIDIDIVFDAPKDFEAIKKGLEKIGYYHNGNQGIPNREVFKRAQTDAKHEILDAITHHLYVCPSDSAQLQRHILFRDYLIAHEVARIEYQNIKYALAEEANQDKKKYAALKEEKAREFIDGIISKARKINDEV
jgi:GrpB-like predicted nucleotidyltransferase (UPF0157 family)